MKAVENSTAFFILIDKLKDKMEVNLLCGEAAAFIVGESYESEKELKLEYIAEIKDFEFVKAEKFEITKDGIIKTEVKEIEGVFSGNVTYKAKLVLDEEIKKCRESC